LTSGKTTHLKGFVIKVFTTAQNHFVYLQRVWKNGSGYQDMYDDGWEIEMLKIIGNSLNILLDIESPNKVKYRTSPLAIYVGECKKLPSMKTELKEPSRITSLYI
jgi:hypothetical protein